MKYYQHTVKTACLAVNGHTCIKAVAEKNITTIEMVQLPEGPDLEHWEECSEQEFETTFHSIVDLISDTLYAMQDKEVHNE